MRFPPTCRTDVPHGRRILATALLLTLGAHPVWPATDPAARKGAEALAGSGPAREAIPTAPKPDSTVPVQVQIANYHGWERSLTIGNGVVEAVVVPAIGRIMQFRFIGQGSPFWEDPSLRGKSPEPSSSEWGNFGGDKTWPSPQADWPKVTPRGWPPPVAFDSMPVEASIRRDTIVLRSGVDPHFGIRTERVISLAHGDPVMRVETTYEKVTGLPLDVGIWIITQLQDPVLVAVALPSPSIFPEGFNRQSGDQLPKGLKLEKDLLSLARDPGKSTKIGTDASRLLWVGARHQLLIESPRSADRRYPDQESSAEVYTNPDPKTYVELEMLGPLKRLAAGDTLRQTNTYTLFPRTLADPAADAAKILGRR